MRGGSLTELTQSPRERVIALVGGEPGLHLREFPRRLGVSLRTARYHLGELEAEGAVVAKHHGRFVRYFAQGSFSRSECEAIAAAKVAGSRAVVAALARRGALAFAELARASRLSNGALAWHLYSLTSSGVVEPREGKRYTLVDRGAVEMALALHSVSVGAAVEDAAREIFDGALADSGTFK